MTRGPQCWATAAAKPTPGGALSGPPSCKGERPWLPAQWLQRCSALANTQQPALHTAGGLPRTSRCACARLPPHRLLSPRGLLLLFLALWWLSNFFTKKQ